jgi:hypothetical protein
MSTPAEANFRELLELAAKAVGMALWPDPWREIGPRYSGLLVGEGNALWRPHQDDGDALRLLAAMAKRRVICLSVGIDVVACEFNYQPVHENDIQVATRLAILRAAAEIGRSML